MRHGRRAVLLVLVLVAIAGGLVPAAGGAARAAGGWQTILTANAQGVFMYGWASGRVWFLVDGSADDMTVWSARVGSHGLTSLVSTSEGKNEWMPNAFIVGSNLVDCCAPQPSSVVPSSSFAQLLPGGKVGAWSPLPGGPEKLTQDTFTPPGMSPPGRWAAGAGLTVGGRTIWAITGALCPPSGPNQCTINKNGISSFAVCCSATNVPVELTPLLTNRNKAGATAPLMGTDSHGRTWLAWLDGSNSKPGISFKLLQLDPATLAPGTAKTLDPVLLYDYLGSGTQSFALACADTCRLVFQSTTGAESWDGAGSPTRLWANNLRTDAGGHLVAAASMGGKLVIGSWADKVAGIPDDGLRLRAARAGDAAGHSLRTTGTIDIPHQLADGPTHYFLPQGLPVAVVTPSGLAAVALYASDRPGGPRGRVLATVLPG